MADAARREPVTVPAIVRGNDLNSRPIRIDPKAVELKWAPLGWVRLLLAGSVAFAVYGSTLSKPLLYVYGGGWWCVLLAVSFQAATALAVVCVVRTIRTPPGTVPGWLSTSIDSAAPGGDVSQKLVRRVEKKKSNGQPRVCRNTGVFKPDRAHYSCELGACVLQYQLYSPTLNSAIGLANHKFYVLASLYSALAFACSAVLLLPQGSVPNTQSMLVAGAVAATLALPCAWTFAHHLRLICVGRTHVEWQQVRRGVRPAEPSPFDYGVCNNLHLALGPPQFWLLPLRHGIRGDGLYYPAPPPSRGASPLYSQGLREGGPIDLSLF